MRCPLRKNAFSHEPVKVHQPLTGQWGRQVFRHKLVQYTGEEDAPNLRSRIREGVVSDSLAEQLDKDISQGCHDDQGSDRKPPRQTQPGARKRHT